MKNAPFLARLGFALHGLRAVFARERSFRTQCAFALGAAVAVAVLRPGLVWAGLVAIAVALVLALELVNSALEYLIDQVHPDLAPQIKLAKDAAAGAVLVASAGAVVVGALMLASLSML